MWVSIFAKQMKKMRNLIGILLVVMVSAGCATKEEKARTNITRAWRISKVFLNGNDVTSTYLESKVEYSLTFSNSGSFAESYRPFSGTDVLNVSGIWAFSDGINKVTLTSSSQTRLYQIDELSQSNLNITDLDLSNNHEIQFVPT